MKALIADIRSAFSDRALPAPEDITHCSYYRKYGGAYDGPCWECADMTEFFAGRRWADLSARELRRHGDADSLFTVEAYCYLLPAYLVAALADPDELDVCCEHLDYRFGPKPTDEWGNQHLKAIFASLSDKELDVLIRYFEFDQGRTDDFDGYRGRCIGNISQELKRRRRR